MSESMSVLTPNPAPNPALSTRYEHATLGGVGTGGSNGVSDRLTGNGAASYIDPVFGPVICNETQHRKFDTVSCRLVTSNPALAGTSATVGWNSDFTGGGFGSFTYTFDADGAGYSGKATY